MLRETVVKNVPNHLCIRCSYKSVTQEYVVYYNNYATFICHFIFRIFLNMHVVI